MPEFTDPWLPRPGDDGRVAAVRAATPIRVWRVNSTPGDGESDPRDVKLQELPGVACLAVEEREGPHPATALFRYKFDGRDRLSPQSAEQAVSTAVTAARLPHVVEIGDRLAVSATRPDGASEWVFDGFPLTWSVRVDAGGESVVLQAVGIAKRCWDDPLPGAYVRDSDEPEAVNDTPTDLVAQFNPRGAANASPGSADSGESPRKYPVFMDESLEGTDVDGVDFPRYWTLPMAAAYLLYSTGVDAGGWVVTPKRSALDALLTAYEPLPSVPFDPADPSTYTAKPIRAPDTPLTGRPWPAALHELIRPAGFGMRFTLASDSSGLPLTGLELFLRRQLGAPKPLLLQERGARFDPARSNLGGCELARDLSGVANRYAVVGHQVQYEASFVLAPGFPSLQSDGASSASLQAFNSSDPSFDATASHDKYRLWVLDEDGSGHFPNNPAATAGPTVLVSGTATSLDDVLGTPDTSTTPATPAYGARRRPPLGRLVTPDDAGRPLKYRLSISTDYAGAYPKKWDGTGTWQPVTGGFELLPDRVGIRITAANPNAWNIGKTSAASMPFPAGVVKAVESTANPTTANPTVYLRLTCVIEGDAALLAIADRQSTSPLKAVITRQVDARDRLLKQVVAKKSEFNTTTAEVVARDDTALAEAEAAAYRRDSEAGVMEGSATIPRFTRAYQVGDRISGILGRDLTFRTDNGGPGYAPVYPAVAAVRWEFEPAQKTVLEISDSGLDRRGYRTSPTAGPRPAAPGPYRRAAT